MKRTAKLLITTALTFVIGIFVWGAYYFYDSRRGEIFDDWETANAEFKIRISAYKEMAAFTPGAYYVFQSTKVGSDDWQEFMTLRTDGLVVIPREQVRIVSDQVGYAFMRNKYAVTTDGGATWNTWDAVEVFSEGQSNHATIKEVRLAPDGTGTMTFTTIANRQAPELHTQDYGRHWNVE